MSGCITVVCIVCVCMYLGILFLKSVKLLEDLITSSALLEIKKMLHEQLHFIKRLISSVRLQKYVHVVNFAYWSVI